MHYDELCEEIDNTPFDEDDGPPGTRRGRRPRRPSRRQRNSRQVHGVRLVVGWLLCPPNNYGEELWTANVSLVAACRELNTFGLLLGRDLGHGPILPAAAAARPRKRR